MKLQKTCEQSFFVTTQIETLHSILLLRCALDPRVLNTFINVEDGRRRTCVLKFSPVQSGIAARMPEFTPVVRS